MRYKTYLTSALLGLKHVTNYRLEGWLGISSNMVSLASILLIWSVVLKTENTINTQKILGYLLIANGIRELVDGTKLRFAANLAEEIKQGNISSLVLRPLNPVVFLYFGHLGTRGVNILFALINIGAGLVVAPPPNMLAVLLFGVTIPIAFLLAFTLNTLVGQLALWLPETGGIRSVFVHTIRVLSGSMIPLSYFPLGIKKLILFSPFPALGFLPSSLVQDAVSMDNMLALLASIAWVLILVPFTAINWQRGFRHYESVGI